VAGKHAFHGVGEYLEERSVRMNNPAYRGHTRFEGEFRMSLKLFNGKSCGGCMMFLLVADRFRDRTTRMGKIFKSHRTMVG
jgi:hypothetical protein